MKANKIIANWKILRLSSVIDAIENGNRPKGGVSGFYEGIPSIGGEHISSNGSFDFSKIKYVPKVFFQNQKRGKIIRDDVLIVKDGATTGKVTLVRENFPFSEAMVNEHVFILRTKKDIVLPDYLFYFIYSNYGQIQIQKNFHGSAQGGINTKFIDNFDIPIPPLEIQRRIVTTLKKVEEIKKKREEANQLIRTARNSILLKIIGDPSRCTWTKLPLGEICSLIRDGPHKRPQYVNTGIPFLTVHNISEFGFLLDDVFYISNEQHEEFKKRVNPQKGDVLYTKGGTTGIAKEVDVDFEFSIYVHLALLRPYPTIVNPTFLEVCLNSDYCRTQARNLTRGIANRDLVLGQMRQIIVPIPPLELQKKVATMVDVVKKIQKIERQSSPEIENFYKILMAKAFNGDLFV